MINSISTAQSNYIHNNLYDCLKENFDNYQKDSILFSYLFNNYEKKQPRTDGKIDDNIRAIINSLRSIIENKDFFFPNDLIELHQKLTIFETHPEKIKKANYYKPEQVINLDFPIILRYLNFKIDCLKSIHKKKKAPGIKKKIDEEDLNISKKELLDLLTYYETCDTLSRCYDFLFRMKNKSDTPNCYLQLIQYLYEQNHLSDYDLFKTINKKNIQETRDILLNNKTIKEASFFIPLLTDSATNTMLVMVRGPEWKHNESMDAQIKEASQKIKNAKIASQFPPEMKKITISYYLYNWDFEYDLILKYKSTKIVEANFNPCDVFLEACKKSQAAIQKYNQSLAVLKGTDRTHLKLYLPHYQLTSPTNTNDRSAKQKASTNREAVGKFATFSNIR